MLQRWQADEEFARQRLSGTNPFTLRRCIELPQHIKVEERQVDGLLPAGATLDGEIKSGRVYFCDYAMFDNAACVPGRYLFAPFVLFHQPKAGSLRPIAIQLGQDPSRHPLLTPKDGPWAWLFAKVVAQCADHHHQQLLGHVLNCHYYMEPFWVAANRQLAPTHPVRELLAPHFRFTMFFNEGARDIVCSADGSMQRLKATGLGGSMDLMRNAYRASTFSDLGFPDDLARRGVDSAELLPDYGYRDDGLLLHGSIARYVNDMLARFYASPADIAADTELQAWAAEVTDPRYGAVVGLPGNGRITTVEQLRTICTNLIFRASAYHAALSESQADDLCCVPNLPFALYQPLPRDAKSISEKYVLAALPPRAQALRQVFIVQVATSEPVYHLGNPDPNYWLSQPEASARRAQFAAEMRDVSRQISERNRTRRPYTSLDPLRVSESIAN